MSLAAYSKIYALGHRAVKDIFTGPVHVQEKVDGSQFSFALNGLGRVVMRSRGGVLEGDIQKLFQPAAAWVAANKDKLMPGWTYRGEALYRCKHNVLTYGRVPEAGFVLFDVDRGLCDYLDPQDLHIHSKHIGVECVPTLYQGVVANLEQVMEFMERESFLGGCKIEGMVFKNYEKFDEMKKTLMAKYVSEEFKEVHRKDPNWAPKEPYLKRLADRYCTEARWAKSLQHLTEEGKLSHDPKDIGTLVREISSDVHSECSDQIKDELFKEYWPKISKGITRGVAQWYKDKLAKEQFE